MRGILTACAKSNYVVDHAGIRVRWNLAGWINVIIAIFLLGGVTANGDVRAKRVLILISANVTYPGVVSIYQSTIQQLSEKSPDRLELLPEFLDLARFSEAGYEILVARFLAEKYSNARPDIVITVGRQASLFVIKFRDSIARDAPLVLCCLPPETFAEFDKSPNVTGIISPRDITKTVDLAERLQPTARNLVVIAGATEFDKEWARIAQQQIEIRNRKFDTRYLIGVPYEQLMKDVSVLPRDTIVVALTYFSDRYGARYISPDVIRGVAKAASAPVYSPYETSLGHGLVGGYSEINETMGAQLADLALDVLGGKKPDATTPKMSTAGGYRVDSRQLERWNLSASALPAGTVVSFQTPSFWDEHRNLIFLVIAVLGALLGIAVFVIVQNVRRVRAERSLDDTENRMAFAAISTNSGLWQLKAEDQPILATDYCRELFELPKNALLTLDGLLPIVHPEDRDAFGRAIRATARNGVPLNHEFRIIRRDAKVHWIAAKGQPIRHGKAQPIVVSGIFTDVTALKEVEIEAETRRLEVAHLMRQSMLNELSASIAHELNQPLTAIMSNAEAASDLLSRKNVDT